MQHNIVHIINILEKKGYRRLNPESNNVYGRTGDDAVYVVVIGSNYNLSAQALMDFNDKIRHDLSPDSQKKICILNILLAQNGMFDDNTKEIVENMNNVWLFTEDYGKLYIYENQPADFDGLFYILDKETNYENEKTHNQLRRMFGVVTPILVVLNILVYVSGIFISEIYNGLDISRILAINVYGIAEKGEYYRFISSFFTHFGFAHLFGNMVILIALGARVENIVGKINFIIIYLICGLASAFASYVDCYFNGSYAYSAGASGAIFGLLGVLVAIAVKNKGAVKDLSLINMVILFIFTMINGYLSEGIDNIAHLTGFICGLIVGILLIVTNQKVVKNSSI